MVSSTDTRAILRSTMVWPIVLSTALHSIILVTGSRVYKAIGLVRSFRGEPHQVQVLVWVWVAVLLVVL